LTHWNKHLTRAIEGTKTTIPSHLKILSDEYYRKDETHTRFVHERIGGFAAEDQHEGEEVAALSAVLAGFFKA